MSGKALGVGHCGFDAPRIAEAVAKAGGAFENVDTPEQALTRLREGGFALVLPNRVLGADERGGVRLVEAIKADPALSPVAVMLVSGYEESQSDAVRAGAEPGFGKSDLGSDAVIERLRPYFP